MRVGLVLFSERYFELHLIDQSAPFEALVPSYRAYSFFFGSVAIGRGGVDKSRYCADFFARRSTFRGDAS